MSLAPLSLADVKAVGIGIGRPEDVAISRDGRVFASDTTAAVSEILPSGKLRRIGRAGHEPNGINLTPSNTHIIIANITAHLVQSCELSTGEVKTICDRVGDRPLRHPNYPAVARSGRIYCSASTQGKDLLGALVSGTPDGYVFSIETDGTVELLADSVGFPNCMAFDANERYLYVCRTAACDVVRFPVHGDGGLGTQEPYGPQLGHRSEWGQDAEQALWGDRPHTLEEADYKVFGRWGTTDGCAFDIEGNLWVTLPSAHRIVAITPDLDVVEVLADPEGGLMRSPTSVSFGGPDMRDVYIGSHATDHVLKARSPVAGLPLTGQIT